MGVGVAVAVCVQGRAHMWHTCGTHVAHMWHTCGCVSMGGRKQAAVWQVLVQGKPAARGVGLLKCLSFLEPQALLGKKPVPWPAPQPELQALGRAQRP